MLEMLDEYSRGKVLTIQTQRKRKVKKNKKKNKGQAQRRQNQNDFNVQNNVEGQEPNPAGQNEDANEQIEEFVVDYSDDEMDEDLESEEEENVERQFNFISELTVLVDYNVIDKYLLVLQNE